MKKKNRKNSPPFPEKVSSILALLDEHYPQAQCTLNFETPLQLLIATILSAQCTDERVNKVTPHLFEKYPKAKVYAETSLQELETDIRSTGFYRNKAKNIRASCLAIHERFGGEVPSDLDALVQLPGIGRKTANVVLSNAFHVPAVVVDTHVGRVSQRLGLTSCKDPVKIEEELMVIIPRERWIRFSHQIIQLGRKICHARKPECPICPFLPHCDYGVEMVDQPSHGN
jgi:endonuclease-3